MLALLAAAQAVAPELDQGRPWFNYDEVPSYLYGGGSWQVALRVVVSPDGKILNCGVEVEGTVPALDTYACRLMRRRGKFRPAQIDGRAAHGVYRVNYNVSVADSPGQMRIPSSADIQAAVNRLPAGLKSPTSVRLAFVVDQSGGKSSCTPSPTWGSHSTEPALVAVACDQVMKDFKATPAKVAGEPVVSVQNALVEFFAPASGESK